MKWPSSVTLIRHAPSANNVLRHQWEGDKDWREFVAEFEADHHSASTRQLAEMLFGRYKLGSGDWSTPAIEDSLCHAETMARALAETQPRPHEIFVSPYLRTKQTLEAMVRGWPELDIWAPVEEERIREQEHGLATIYSSRRIFFAFHPEQYDLYKLEGQYWYRYPQGEKVPDVRERVRSFLATIIREYSEKHVMIVTHHLAILSFMAALGRWDDKIFMVYNEHHKPINCGVTRYHGNPSVGKDGRHIPVYYNKKLY